MLLGVTIVLVGSIATAVVLSQRDTGPWSDGEIHGRWTVMYTGYGEVSGHDEEVVLEPKSAASEDITHGGLVHTTRSYMDPTFEVTVHTEFQVRDGPPNGWEVGWVLWNLSDDEHFYAVALKPNGWEISKQDPVYPGKQRFITTGVEPQFPIGQDYRVRVEHDWPRMTVSVGGRVLATITDDERPYRGGTIGLYTEDARVRFSDLDILDAASD
ncbi:calcium-binding protein [Pseudarthrobacter enclensis]|uniref:Calcium-binding protein n=1 Tax=Pseudarthrobacter enclensis TaxID=993070 RepID=A0A0V8IX43_9MICC|nr:calcium-binding protein [Pseudarthrobacter enclensis]